MSIQLLHSTLQFISFARRPFFGKAEIENSIKIVHLIGHSKLSNLFQEYDFPSMDKLSTNRIIHSCHPNYEKKKEIYTNIGKVHRALQKDFSTNGKQKYSKKEKRRSPFPSFILRPLRAKGRRCYYSCCCCCFQTNRNTTTTKSSWP